MWSAAWEQRKNALAGLGLARYVDGDNVDFSWMVITWITWIFVFFLGLIPRIPTICLVVLISLPRGST